MLRAGPYLILGSACLVLLIGVLMLGGGSPSAGQTAVGRPKLDASGLALVDQLARLDAEHAGSSSSDEAYVRRRAELKATLRDRLGAKPSRPTGT